MNHPGFWTLAGPFSLSEIAAYASASIPDAFQDERDARIHAIRSIEDADKRDLSFLSNRKYLGALAASKAKAVFVAHGIENRVPSGTVPLIAKDPYLAFAKALELFYPDAHQTKIFPGVLRSGQQAPLISADAKLEDNVVIEPGAMVGPEAQIGRNTRISAGAVIGYRCAVGRDCFIGPHASVTHALIGNRVTIHGGARIGQDGFGFVMGAGGHYKVRQVGRVIIQDDVEVGANSAIDRGALRDTIIGEGTKIDNLVQIAHNVVTGRHCVIVSQTGISGSTVLEDFVVLGGQCGTVGHIRIGAGAQVAAQSGVASDVPRGERWGGYPAKPMSIWTREVAMLKRLVKRRSQTLAASSQEEV